MTTQNQGFDLPSAGEADWDTSLNAALTVMDKGILLRATAAVTISSGEAVYVNSNGQAYLHDPMSLDLRAPHAVAYDVTSSGDEGYFVAYGVVRSMAVYSGHITPGEPVFTAQGSPGFLVSSYYGAAFPVGIAIGADAILVAPGMHSVTPREVTQVRTVAALAVGTTYDFDLPLGHRGIVRDLRVTMGSSVYYSLKFWSGSARVSSELLYETLTTSVDGGAGDYDVGTEDYRDAALFPWKNTDTASPALIFGTIAVQSSSNAGSADFVCTVIGEMFG